jgi:hypothetical protein
VIADASAQDLEPRAYSPTPVGSNFLGALYQHSTGGAPLDPSLPVKDARVTVEAPAVFYSRTFDLLGRQASAALVLPYAWADAKAEVFDEAQAGRRSGPGDPRFRFATNIIGGPAVDLEEFLRRPPSTSLGTSLTVVAPFGQYYSQRLFNVGSNRWALKPELGLSQPIGPWAAELSGGAWFFTANEHFFGGKTREQDPIVTVQTHVSYTFAPGLWLSGDATYYAGGRSTVGGVRNDDRQEATRVGLTLSLPIAEGYSLKLAWTDTVATRLAGSGFTTWMVTFQIAWFDK